MNERAGLEEFGARKLRQHIATVLRAYNSCKAPGIASAEPATPIFPEVKLVCRINRCDQFERVKLLPTDIDFFKDKADRLSAVVLIEPNNRDLIALDSIDDVAVER